MKLLDFLNIFDVFRSPIHFRMKNSEKTSTNLGIFLSIIIYGIIIYAFTESDIFYKISPKILTETKIVKNRPQLQSKGKLFAISITDFDGITFFDPTVFSISIKNEKYVSSNDGTQFDSFITTKSYHFCNESDVENPQDFYDYLLVNNLCLDEPSFNIEGSFSEPSISYLAIRVLLCQNSSENNNSCKSFEQSSSILKGKYFNLIFFTDTIELKDHENPFQSTYQALSQKLDPKINKELTIYMQKVLTNTDDGIIFSNKNVKEGLQIERKEYDFTTNDLENGEVEIASFLFYSSEKVLTLGRNYQTLSEAIAILGGLYSFLFIIGNLMSHIDTKIFLTQVILNELYIFPKERKKSKEQANKASIIEIVKTENLNKTEKEMANKNELVPINSAKYSNPDNTTKKEFPHSQNISEPSLLKKTSEPQQEINENKENNYNNENIEINENNEKSSLPKNGKLQKKVLKDDSFIMDDNSEKKEENLEENKGENRNSILQKSSALTSPRKKSFFHWRSMKKKTEDFNYHQWEAFQNIDKNQTISFNLLDYLALQFKKITNFFTLNEKEQLFLKAEKLFNEEINIIQILRKIQDIEKLKYLLLDKKQLLLLSLLEKPIIHLENQEKLERLSIFLPNEKKDLKEAFEHYKNLENKKNKETLDGKLFNLIDKRIKKI